MGSANVNYGVSKKVGLLGWDADRWVKLQRDGRGRGAVVVAESGGRHNDDAKSDCRCRVRRLTPYRPAVGRRRLSSDISIETKRGFDTIGADLDSHDMPPTIRIRLLSPMDDRERD